jgi:hypothetical protein
MIEVLQDETIEVCNDSINLFFSKNISEQGVLNPSSVMPEYHFENLLFVGLFNIVGNLVFIN